ncbi:MAG: biotin--[acetyl-CoA-carboxylase] ligase [Desulfobacterales bacterium]|nr:biotin--[acetyl-CoA-carboxylase] ligase [Desulfobacterales bacterium]
MKTRILNQLRAASGIISGESLSAEFGISRVSIWKHIRKLQEIGYNIIATPKGYRLIDSLDALFPWEFPGRESKIHYFDEVGSTMEIARDLARKGCPDFTVVVSGKQKKGRGRLQRVWLSSDGGLYFTLILRPKIPPVLCFRINFLASQVLAETLRTMFNINAMVKWPNDILVNNKKISGMLSEMETEADLVTFVNIGIGLNVNNDPTHNEPNAISLKKILNHEISRKKILSEYLDQFEKRMINPDFENIIPEWKKYTMTLNQSVRIVTTQDVTEGIAIDVDENGALILRLADGSTKKVIYGDCFLQNT